MLKCCQVHKARCAKTYQFHYASQLQCTACDPLCSAMVQKAVDFGATEYALRLPPGRCDRLNPRAATRPAGVAACAHAPGSATQSTANTDFYVPPAAPVRVS